MNTGWPVLKVTVCIFCSLFQCLHVSTFQIKSLLLSHHHSTSALVSEILMSVLQTVQKNNRQFTYGQTVQKKTTNNLHMDRQCKKLHWSIYSAPDSAKKKQQQQFTYGQTVQKKTTTAIYIWTDSAKKTTAIYIWTVHMSICSTNSVSLVHDCWFCPIIGCWRLVWNQS